MQKPDVKKLPPMKTLMGFEAVARLLSFRHAADELHLSHQAISQQITQLENSLGQPLLLRNNRQVSLTPAGERFYQHVAVMLRELINESESIRQEQQKPCLKIHTYVTVALRWLVPKLADFRSQYPEIDVQLLSTIHGEHFNEQHADIGLVFQPQHLAPHLQWQQLLIPSFYPVCHPDLVAGKDIKNGDDLIQLPLINITSERLQWQDWFAHLDIDYDDINIVTVDSTAVALEMATAGDGVALIYDPVVEQELARGRLIKPVQKHIMEYAPWGLVYHRDKADWPPIRHFVEWVSQQMQQYKRE